MACADNLDVDNLYEWSAGNLSVENLHVEIMYVKNLYIDKKNENVRI